jgi:putative Mg2+ transporter-C (MgtC) family protein
MEWEVELALRVAAGLGFGAAIGLERQWRQRMAGLRTNALVAVGAALFVALSLGMDDDASPTRVAAQVVSGIGFLGGGVIIRDGLSVRGINTAATLWCAAAVGTLAGAGLFLLGALGTLAVVLIHVGLRPVAHLLDKKSLGDQEFAAMYRFRAVCRADQEAHIRALLVQALAGGEFQLRSVFSADLDPPGSVAVSADLYSSQRDDAALERAVSRLSLEPSVSSVSWTALVPDDTNDDGSPGWLRRNGD